MAENASSIISSMIPAYPGKFQRANNERANNEETKNNNNLHHLLRHFAHCCLDFRHFDKVVHGGHDGRALL
jgi:hypothetical protein